jgi:hypothetical protein
MTEVCPAAVNVWHYRIEKYTGAGGMGFRATDTPSGLPAAIMTILDRFSDASDAKPADQGKNLGKS